MEMDRPSTDTVAAGSTRWFGGCALSAIIIAALVACGAYAVEDLEQGLDGYGQMERAGRSGPLVVRPGKSLDDYVTDYDPGLTASPHIRLRPGATAHGGREAHSTRPRQADPGGVPVTVEVAVPGAGYRETAYFQLTVG
ncbi:hypothetical protein ABZV75_19800 [Streptomyces flaveolus]|uniref:hypothetical protein n=1 Tax=Streptomyces flaveolus TaxID=67297 RepID=UPI0033A5586A